MSKKIILEFTEEDADELINLLRDILDRIDEGDILETDLPHDVKVKNSRRNKNGK